MMLLPPPAAPARLIGDFYLPSPGPAAGKKQFSLLVELVICRCGQGIKISARSTVDQTIAGFGASHDGANKVYKCSFAFSGKDEVHLRRERGDPACHLPFTIGSPENRDRLGAQTLDPVQKGNTGSRLFEARAATDSPVPPIGDRSSNALDEAPNKLFRTAELPQGNPGAFRIWFNFPIAVWTEHPVGVKHVSCSAAQRRKAKRAAREKAFSCEGSVAGTANP